MDRAKQRLSTVSQRVVAKAIENGDEKLAMKFLEKTDKRFRTDDVVQTNNYMQVLMNIDDETMNFIL
jgi:hypothetical protein